MGKIDFSDIPSVNFNYSPYDLSNYYIHRYNKKVKLGNKIGLCIAIFGVLLSLIDGFRGNGFLGILLFFLLSLIFIHISIRTCISLLGLKDVINKLKSGNFLYLDTVIAGHSTEDEYSYNNDRTDTYYSGKKRFISFRDTDMHFNVDLFSRYPIGTNVVLLVVNKNMSNGAYSNIIIEVFKKV